uniref:Uncharacterized protein n=1 Tax=Lepeophtheirus salmonis TaxID=72036 RepID=A0A0K2TGG1_LEPSM
MSVFVTRKGIRMKRSKYMTNSRTRNGFQYTTTLPNSKTHL